MRQEFIFFSIWQNRNGKDQGAFVALSIGLSVALLVFVVEVLVTNVCRTSRKTLNVISLVLRTYN